MMLILLLASVVNAAPPCANVDACVNEGLRLDRSSKLAERKQAAAYERACDLKDWSSCASVGFMYAEGDTGTKDPKRAFAFRQRACDGGVKLACTDLGIHYATGDGVEKDVAKALPLLTRSCDARIHDGCLHLAFLKRDAGERPAALDLFVKACDFNMKSPACREIPTVVNTLTPDEQKKSAGLVASALRLACECGVPDTCR